MTVEQLREMLEYSRTNGLSYGQEMSLNVIAEALVGILEILEKQQEEKNAEPQIQNRPG